MTYHFQNTLTILIGRKLGKIVTSRILSEINANIKVPVNMPSQVLENQPDIAITITITIAKYKLETSKC